MSPFLPLVMLVLRKGVGCSCFNIPVPLRYESLSSAGDVSPKKRIRM
jgi:hypothetical protein